MPESEHSVSASGASEQKTPPEEHAVWEELIEIIEVTVLALVAFATANRPALQAAQHPSRHHHRRLRAAPLYRYLGRPASTDLTSGRVVTRTAR